MKIAIASTFLSEQFESIVFFVHEGEVVGGAFESLVKDRAEVERFRGKAGEVLVVQQVQVPRTILVVGLGRKESCSVETRIQAAAIAARKIKQFTHKTVAVILGTVRVSEVVVGLRFGSYEYLVYKQPLENKTDLEFTLVTEEQDAESSLKQSELVTNAVIYARNLVNQSPSETTPELLAQQAETIAKNSENVSCTVVSKSQMETLGMGGLLGIARGTIKEPKFIHLVYKGAGSRTITLIGKGITFDSGGLSLKPAPGMETMKLDMSGAALVLAVFSVVSQLKPSVTLHGLIPATENMIGPDALKPGDVVRAMNGKTIEVLNTDAEGRIVIADALSYAATEIQSSVIIDVATLTGACMIALGEDVAGLFSNNADLAKSLKSSAQRAGEKLWELPLVEDYKEKLKSPVADIKNIGGKYGGAITGALFIQEFVPENTPWAHLDIAGPSFTEKGTPLCPHGGTGFGIQTIINYLTTESSH